MSESQLRERLRRLATRRDDCRLVLGLLHVESRVAAGELEPLEPVARRIQRRVATARTHVAGPEYSGDETQRTAHLEFLIGLESLLERMGSVD